MKVNNIAINIDLHVQNQMHHLNFPQLSSYYINFQKLKQFY